MYLTPLRSLIRERSKFARGCFDNFTCIIKSGTLLGREDEVERTRFRYANNQRLFSFIHNNTHFGAAFPWLQREI